MNRPLADSLEFLHAILDAVPSLLFVVDRDVTVVHANAAALRMLGTELDAVLMRRSGEIMNCLHAAETQEGCGRSPSCGKCVIRNSVNEAMQGRQVFREPTRMGLATAAGVREAFYRITATPFRYGEELYALLAIEDATEVMEATEELKRLNELLVRQARTDALTGIANRLQFEETMEAEMSRSRRHGLTFSLIMFDIDHFKRINDTFGHHAGDAVLRELAALVAGHVRRHDRFARWGGEEFMILVVNAPLQNACQFAEKLRREIEEREFAGPGRVTCSFGIAEFDSTDTADTLMRRVDLALYRAKEQGRNRVEHP